MKERDVQQLFCKEVQKRFPKIRVFRRNVGVFKAPHGGYVTIEKKGMSDIYGVYPTKRGLLHLEFEIKTNFGLLTKQQIEWGNFIKNNSGFYFVVRPNNMQVCFSLLKNHLFSLDKKVASLHSAP